MTREVLDKVFNPFFTTKSVDQGTGLGLSVVHGIITAHQGTIDIDSKPGEGTTISISLPVTGEEKTKKDQYD
jgi:two-component system NtrC family sensor kinase